MRVLFVSGVNSGGAAISTRSLARRLAAREHDVGLVLGEPPQPSGAYDLVVRAAVKVREHTGSSLPRVLARPAGWVGLRAQAEPDAVREWTHPSPENVVRRLMRGLHADVIVANSLPRERMRWLVSDARRAGRPVVLYMREDHSTTHLSVSRLPFDLVVANSEHLAASARDAGYNPVVVPSVVELTASLCQSTRTSVVLVNPIAENQPEILRELAELRPDIRCVLQESWKLPDSDLARLQCWAAQLPNLELRPRTPTISNIYADAKLIVAPYQGGRPRTVLEAQANSIPVIGRDQPALAEAIGPGGILMPSSAEPAAWAATIQHLWDDQARYSELSALAAQHAQRADVDPGRITVRFEQALKQVVG